MLYRQNPKLPDKDNHPWASTVSYTHLDVYKRQIFVGLNANSAEKWDICLDSEFDTLADVNASI